MIVFACFLLFPWSAMTLDIKPREEFLALESELEKRFKELESKLTKDFTNELKQKTQEIERLSELVEELRGQNQEMGQIVQRNTEKMKNLGNQVDLNAVFAAIIDSPTDTYLPFGDVKNYKELTDSSNSFNPATGVFTISDYSYEGTYIISYSGRCDGVHGGDNVDGNIRVIKNNDYIVQDNYDGDENSTLQMNGMVAIYLQLGDELKLYNMFDDSIYINGYAPLTFTGHKI